MGEDMPWDDLARKFIDSLGIEIGRALLYAFIINTVYPQLYTLISDLVEKQRRGEISREEAVAIIERELRNLKNNVPVTGEPEKDLAYTLKKAAETPPLSPKIIKLRNLARELDTYEEIKRELLKKKYLTSDPNERKRIEEDLREVEERISELKRAIDELESEK